MTPTAAVRKLAAHDIRSWDLESGDLVKAYLAGEISRRTLIKRLILKRKEYRTCVERIEECVRLATDAPDNVWPED